MKLLVRAALAGVVGLSGAPDVAAAEPAKTTLAVQGMTCGGCVAAVKIQLKRTEGVTAYEVSLEKAEARVSYDPAKTTPARIAESVSKTGFEASVKDSAGDETSALGAEESSAATPSDANAPGLESLAGDHGPLVSAFNAAKGRQRFLAILSPTCPLCVHGAEAIREAILPTGSAIEVFVVWTPMLGGDSGTVASASSLIVAAPGVRQYWDPEQRVGKAFRKDVFPHAVERMKRSVAKDHFCAESLEHRDASQPEWDIYLFFDPGVEWTDGAPVPARFVRQTARFGGEKDGTLVSLMWKNDYASPPIEGSLTEELQRLLSSAGARRVGAAR